MGSNSIKLNSNLESPNVMNRRLSSPTRRTSYNQNELQDESELRNQTVKITSIQQPELIKQPTRATGWAAHTRPGPGPQGATQGTMTALVA